MAGTDSFGLVGSILDQNYRIDGVLGEGGFGVVYKGWHLAFDEPVAIKCLKVPPHFTAEARQLFAQRFREEGRLLRKLGERHPAIVRAHDVRILSSGHGRLDGVPYMVLEWLDGHTLDEALRQRMAHGQGPFAEAAAIALLTPAMDALAVAHRGDLGQVIAHRDIKPENLFVLRDGRVKVLDFGIAKAMQEGEDRTQQQSGTSSGFSAFSPGYGAPEQFSSKKFGESGPRTDVHALGLVLSEMVSGRSPYEGGQYADLFLEAIAPERPTPRKHGARVSDEFEAVCARALALRPQERFANAGELLAALRGEPVPASPPVSAPPVSAPPVSAAPPVAAPPRAAPVVVTEVPSVATEVPPVTPGATTPWQQPAEGRAGTQLTGAQTVVPAPVLPAPPTSARGHRARPARWGAAAGGVALLVGGVLVWNFRGGEKPGDSPDPLAPLTDAPRSSASDRLAPVSPSAAASSTTTDGERARRADAVGRMVKVAGGSFTMGSADGQPDERPAHPVTVVTFWMDRTEVTVAAWKLCVQAHVCSPTSGVLVKDFSAQEASKWSAHCTESLPGHDTHPINCVDASQAASFCKWAGKRLPTEEEWEFAARGAQTAAEASARPFPWGMENPDEKRLNVCDGACSQQMKAEGMTGFERPMFAGSDGFATTAPVGSFAANPLGLHDMAGNVSEWTSSGYSPTYGAAADPTRRVNRGSHWQHTERANVALARRFKDAPDTRDVVIGFRCASDAEP